MTTATVTPHVVPNPGPMKCSELTDRKLLQWLYHEMVERQEWLESKSKQHREHRTYDRDYHDGRMDGYAEAAVDGADKIKMVAQYLQLGMRLIDHDPGVYDAFNDRPWADK